MMFRLYAMLYMLKGYVSIFNCSALETVYHVVAIFYIIGLKYLSIFFLNGYAIPGDYTWSSLPHTK